MGQKQTSVLDNFYECQWLPYEVQLINADQTNKSEHRSLKKLWVIENTPGKINVMSSVNPTIKTSLANSKPKVKPDWSSLIQRYDNSSLTQVEFCKQEGISFNQFVYQRQKLRGSMGQKQNKLATVNLVFHLIK